MQCHIDPLSGRARLSSLSTAHPRQPARDHAFLDIVQLPSDLASQAHHGRQLGRQQPAQTAALRHLVSGQPDVQRSATRHLLGFMCPAPSDSNTAEGLSATARLDAAWHLSALPEARGEHSEEMPHRLLIPAAVECFSASKAGRQHESQTKHVHAAAAVSPAASGRAGSLTGDFVLSAAGGEAAPCHVSGLMLRPAGSQLAAAAGQLPLQEATAGMTYCMQWQASAPEGISQTAAQLEAGEHALAPAVRLALADYPPARASAAVLATLQRLTLLAASRSSQVMTDVVSSRTSFAGAALDALLRSAVLEHQSELTASSRSDDWQHAESHRSGTARLLVSMATAAAAARSNDASSGTRRASGVRLVPRLLPSSRAGDGTVPTTMAGNSGADGSPSGGCYLVTGGLGALGLAAGGWLLAAGASRVLLISRNAASTTPESARTLSALLRHAPANAAVIFSQADVATPDDMDCTYRTMAVPLTGAYWLPGWPKTYNTSFGCVCGVQRSHITSVCCVIGSGRRCSMQTPIWLRLNTDGRCRRSQVYCMRAVRWRTVCWVGRRHGACAASLQRRPAAPTLMVGAVNTLSGNRCALQPNCCKHVSCRILCRKSCITLALSPHKLFARHCSTPRSSKCHKTHLRLLL